MFDNRGLIRKLAEFNPDLKLFILAPNGKSEITMYSVKDEDVKVIDNMVVIDLSQHTVTESIDSVEESELEPEEEKTPVPEELPEKEESEEKVSKKSKKDV